MAATHFSIRSRYASVAVGIPIPFIVAALDGSNAPVGNYAGTVHFTCSDTGAVLPANATLSSGFGSFSITLRTAGQQALTVTDVTTATITGHTPNVTVSAGFRLGTPDFSVAGKVPNPVLACQIPVVDDSLNVVGYVQLFGATV